jgi:hypothetical protein
MSSFWSDTTLEPKRKYRFRVNLGGDSAYVVTKVKNPTVKISETPHKFLNHTFYYPGRAEWDPIDISFVDPGGPDDQSANLFRKLGASGYRNPLTDAESHFGFTKNQAVTEGVGKVVISQLGDDGSTLPGELSAIATWTLHNPFFTNISWGEYDYNGEEMLECNCTIRYDWATFANFDGPADPFNV